MTLFLRGFAVAASIAAACAATLGAGGALSSCGGDPANPYQPDAAGTTTGGGMGGAGGGNPIDPELGGPCVSDDQCNDGVDCTFDACDPAFARCRFRRDDSLCQNDGFCDGLERCDQKLGCVAGVPASCSDGNACTIDRCVEETETCERVPRDADGDGDPDNHCGGGDCDDANPNVSSIAPEICANGIDDDCDMAKDEADCVSPENDTCLDPLVVNAAGQYVVHLAGAPRDYAATCVPAELTNDVVLAVVLPAGPPRDIDVRVRSASGRVAAAMFGQCGDAASEIACGAPFDGVQSGSVTRFRARAVGSLDEETAWPIVVWGAGTNEAVVTIAIEDPVPAPTNETCGTAQPITPGAPITADLAGAAIDLTSACPTVAGDLVYTFDLAAPQDVAIYGASLDGVGKVALSLRDTACALPEDEISCSVGDTPRIFRHAMAAGTYYVSVSGTAPTRATVTLEVSPPTAAPPDETCATAPVITPGQSVDLDMSIRQDDVAQCFSGGVDAAYTLDLAAPSDVLVTLRTSVGDSAAVSLSAAACGDMDALACKAGGKSPIRVSKRNVPAGSYRAVAESAFGLPERLTAFVRPTGPATLVPFADDCAAPGVIPESGGFFQGNTANAQPDFTAGCDTTAGMPGGARDQILRMVLTQRRRVVFDMTGSLYDTLLDVRRGDTCPGEEMALSCSAGTNAEKSFLDLVLDPGTYFVQIDGLGGLQAGAWFLNVFTADPPPP